MRRFRPGLRGTWGRPEPRFAEDAPIGARFSQGSVNSQPNFANVRMRKYEERDACECGLGPTVYVAPCCRIYGVPLFSAERRLQSAATSCQQPTWQGQLSLELHFKRSRVAAG